MILVMPGNCNVSTYAFNRGKVELPNQALYSIEPTERSRCNQHPGPVPCLCVGFCATVHDLLSLFSIPWPTTSANALKQHVHQLKPPAVSSHGQDGMDAQLSMVRGGRRAQSDHHWREVFFSGRMLLWLFERDLSGPLHISQGEPASLLSQLFVQGTLEPLVFLIPASFESASDVRMSFRGMLSESITLQTS